MKNWILVLSLGLNVVLVGALWWVNERYGLWGKLQRVAIEEGRVPGIAARHEMNRNYQARREMFRLDRNKDAKILFIGDSQVSLADWNAMLGAPLVANRGIEGDTTAGVLARLSDDEDFAGDTVALWIGTNDVLQGEEAGGIAARIVDAVRRMANGEWQMADESDVGGQSSDDRDQRPEDADQRRVIVLSVAPVAEWVARAAERNLVVAEVNERLAAAAPANGFTFVDLDPVLSDGRGYLRGDMTSDGVHLGARGYAAVLELLRPRMANAE